MSVVINAAQNQPPSPRAIADDDIGVELVLALALTKAPEDRFAEVGAFGEAFAAAARGQLSAELRGRARVYLTRFPWSADPPNVGSTPS